MALPLSTPTAAEAYEVIRREGRSAQAMGQQLRAYLNDGSVLSSFLLDVATTSAFIAAEIADIRSVAGLAAYTRAQLGADDTVDVAALLTASVTALATLAGTIRAEYPKNADGFLLDRKFQSDGQAAPVQIAATSLTQTSAALDAFLATLT